MYEEGYMNILNVDFSQICVKQMEEKNKVKFPQMSCKIFPYKLNEDKQLDILDMSKDVKTGEYNVVLDKGTLDSVLVILLF